MMKAAILANHHLKYGKDDEDEEEEEKDCCDQNSGASKKASHMSYEDICHNRIITMWFGSVSHLRLVVTIDVNLHSHYLFRLYTGTLTIW